MGYNESQARSAMAVADRSPLQATIDRLAESITRLSEVAENVVAKAEPVTYRPPQPTSEARLGPGVAPPPAGCAVSDQLYVAIDRIAGLTRTLESLHAALQV